jgi:hypothetical protein
MRVSAAISLAFVVAAPSRGGAQILAPSNLPEKTCATPAATSLDVPSGTFAIDTNVGCDSIVSQPGGPEICVRKFQTVVVSSGAALTVTGTRALALVATSAMVIDGRIDAGPTGTTNGPGTVASGTGDSGMTSSGGGGAGHGSPGAAGGANAGFITAPGGPASGTPELVPLRGGARGGAGGASSLGAAAGGGGGGGLQLVSCATLSVNATGVVEAGGAGGAGALAIPGAGGGGGGGSGGGILIEGVDITVSGTLAANGGGGGEGGSPSTSGNAGWDGQPSLNPAPGGSGGSVAGDGGSGGARFVSAFSGMGGSGTAASGGGGGGVGHIRINVTPSGAMNLTQAAVISPAHTLGTAGLSDLIFEDGFE